MRSGLRSSGFVVIAAMACALVFIGPMAGATGGRTYIPQEGSPRGMAYKPARFTLSGDCGRREVQMHWTTWTHRTAIGHGIDVRANDSCVAIRRRAVDITFTRPRNLCGHYVFTRVKFVFPKHPALNSSENPIFGGC